MVVLGGDKQRLFEALDPGSFAAVGGALRESAEGGDEYGLPSEYNT